MSARRYGGLDGCLAPPAVLVVFRIQEPLDAVHLPLRTSGVDNIKPDGIVFVVDELDKDSDNFTYLFKLIY
jgi:hypothetical protein